MAALVKLSYDHADRWSDKNLEACRALRRSALTVRKHVGVLEAVAAQHEGVLPPYKWLNENGYFSSYDVMMQHPAEFKHIKTYEQQQAEKYHAEPGSPHIMSPTKYKTLAEYNIHGAHFAPTGLDIAPGISESEWMDLGRTLATVCQSVHWWIGDFLQYGFRTYGKKATFDLAQQATGYTRTMLYSCAFIAKRFPPERRVEALTVYHHRAVSNFPPDTADRLLAEAVEVGLTARQIATLGQGESEKKNRFNRKTISVTLLEVDYEALKARAAGKPMGKFVAHILEEWLAK